MKRLLTILAGFCFTAVSAPSQDVRISVSSGAKAPGRTYPRWTVFAHPRFGYELPVPPGVRATGPPDAGADATFVSVDGAFKMTAWGGLSPYPASTVLAKEWENARERPGRTFFYARKNAAGFVMSGVKDGKTRFYEKMIVHGDHIAAFTLTMPNSRAREFGRWIEEIDGGFVLVDDPDAGIPEVTSHVLPASPGVAHDPMLRVADPLARDEWGEVEVLPRSDSASRPKSSPPPPVPELRESTIVNVKPPGKLFSVESSLESLPEAKGAENSPPPDASPSNTSTAPSDASSPKKDSPVTAAELPTGEAVPGKTGFVYSPFLTEKKLVDAVDIPSGTKVKCPYTGKIFRLP